MHFNPIAIPIFVIGTAVLIYAGYKAGQKNGIPTIGAGTTPPALPPSGDSTVGGIDVSTVENDAEDAAIFNLVSAAAPALL
jgi:hypothetical protein